MAKPQNVDVNHNWQGGQQVTTVMFPRENIDNFGRPLNIKFEENPDS